MDSHSANSFNENLKEILFSLDKKVFYLLITFQAILCFGLQNFCSIKNETSFFTIFEFIQIFCLFILVLFYLKVNDNRVGDFLFSAAVIGFDITSLLLFYKYSLEDSNYFRVMYQFICFGLISMNIKSNLNKYFFIFLLALKIIILSIIFQNYNFKESRIVIFLDFFMIIYSFAMILVNRIIKSIFQESLIELSDKNFLMEKKLKNIFNSMKYPVFSIDLKQKEIYFNSSFFNFIDENFRNEEFNTSHLLIPESDNSNLYLNLIRNLKSEEKSFIYKFYGKDQMEQKKCQAFIVKIFILNKIFDKFKFKSQSTPNTLNLFNFFKEKTTFPTQNCFIEKGEYILDCGFSEKIIEFSWKNSSFTDNEEVFDFMFNDITALKEPQLDDNNLCKMRTPILTQNLETPLKSITFYTKKLASKIKFVKSVKNILDINELHNDIYIIEGLEKYVSCLINDLKEHNNHDLDLEIKLEFFELRKIIEDVFHIIKSLISSNPNKKNINLVLNIDENLPKLIKSDPYRIKQLLVNLLSNSYQFTNFGFIKLNIKYEKTNNKTSYDEIKFSVEDTGVGVNKELQTKLFENYQGNSVKSGLSICKKIVCKLGNSIDYIGKNKLTSFNFTLYNLCCSLFKLDSTNNNSNYVTSSISDELDNSKNINLTISDEHTKILVNRNHKLEIIKEHPNPKEEETQRIVTYDFPENNNLSLISNSQMSDDDNK